MRIKMRNVFFKNFPVRSIVVVIRIISDYDIGIFYNILDVTKRRYLWLGVYRVLVFE